MAQPTFLFPQRIRPWPEPVWWQGQQRQVAFTLLAQREADLLLGGLPPGLSNRRRVHRQMMRLIARTLQTIDGIPVRPAWPARLDLVGTWPAVLLRPLYAAYTRCSYQPALALGAMREDPEYRAKTMAEWQANRDMLPRILSPEQWAFIVYHRECDERDRQREAEQNDLGLLRLHFLIAHNPKAAVPILSARKEQEAERDPEEEAIDSGDPYWIPTPPPIPPEVLASMGFVAAPTWRPEPPAPMPDWDRPPPPPPLLRPTPTFANEIDGAPIGAGPPAGAGPDINAVLGFVRTGTPPEGWTDGG